LQAPEKKRGWQPGENGKRRRNSIIRCAAGGICTRDSYYLEGKKRRKRDSKSSGSGFEEKNSVRQTRRRHRSPPQAPEEKGERIYSLLDERKKSRLHSNSISDLAHGRRRGGIPLYESGEGGRKRWFDLSHHEKGGGGKWHLLLCIPTVQKERSGSRRLDIFPPNNRRGEERSLLSPSTKWEGKRVKLPTSIRAHREREKTSTSSCCLPTAGRRGGGEELRFYRFTGLGMRSMRSRFFPG